MSRVFVVTTGNYSDYSIRGIFSEREKAEGFISRIGDFFSDDPSIEEWGIDELAEAEVRTNYRFELPTGQRWTFRVLALPTERVLDRRHWAAQSVFRRPPLTGPLHAWGDSLISFEHARKLAEENMQAELRRAAEPHNTGPLEPQG